jgi:hypothetical protein
MCLACGDALAVGSMRQPSWPMSPHYDRLLMSVVFAAVVALYVRSEADHRRSMDLLTRV